jgi:F0F1-type ATP synthase assembly protein I
MGNTPPPLTPCPLAVKLGNFARQERPSTYTAVADQPDDRSLLARATEWASNATTVAMEMVVPILIGAWIDHRLGFKGVFAIIGGVIGMTSGIWTLLKMVEPLRRDRRRTRNSHEHPREPLP